MCYVTNCIGVNHFGNGEKVPVIVPASVLAKSLAKPSASAGLKPRVIPKVKISMRSYGLMSIYGFLDSIFGLVLGSLKTSDVKHFHVYLKTKDDVKRKLFNELILGYFKEWTMPLSFGFADLLHELIALLKGRRADRLRNFVLEMLRDPDNETSEAYELWKEHFEDEPEHTMVLYIKVTFSKHGG